MKVDEVFVYDPRACQKERNKSLLPTERFWNEKSPGSRKAREIAIKSQYGIESFAHGPFPLKEKA
jgi:hypothetical protein